MHNDNVLAIIKLDEGKKGDAKKKNGNGSYAENGVHLAPVNSVNALRTMSARAIFYLLSECVCARTFARQCHTANDMLIYCMFGMGLKRCLFCCCNFRAVRRTNADAYRSIQMIAGKDFVWDCQWIGFYLILKIIWIGLWYILCMISKYHILFWILY